MFFSKQNVISLVISLTFLLLPSVGQGGKGRSCPKKAKKNGYDYPIPKVLIYKEGSEAHDLLKTPPNAPDRNRQLAHQIIIDLVGEGFKSKSFPGQYRRSCHRAINQLEVFVGNIVLSSEKDMKRLESKIRLYKARLLPRKDEKRLQRAASTSYRKGKHRFNAAKEISSVKKEELL